MIFQRILLVGVLFLYPSIIQKSDGQSTCTSGQIFRDEVAQSQCTCRVFYPHGSCSNRCPVGQTICSVVDSGIYLADCNSDCTSVQNKDCDACGVWLSSLCLCEKFPSSCVWQHATGESWVQLARKNLATPNQPIHNILSLQTHQSLAMTGWDFGQLKYDPTSQGLAINPVRTVTQDQVHMHICPFNSDMRTFLTKMSTASISTYKTLTQIKLDPQFVQGNPPTMWCFASQTKNNPIKGNLMYDAINSVLQMNNVCNYNVAAAVMRDSNGYTWGCVTGDDHGDSEHRFLKNCN